MKWISKWFAHRSASRKPTPRLPRRLCLEALEDRCLMSGYAAPYGFTPIQIRQAYGINAISLGGVVGDGTGQTIAIVDAYDDPKLVNSTDSNFMNSDLHQFDAYFNLPDPPSFTKVNETGGTTLLPTADPAGPSAPTNWEAEEALNVEWAHALAPGAKIILVEASSSNASDMIGAGVNWARQQPGVSVVSVGYDAASDFAGETGYDSVFTTPVGHAGVTFVAPAGDTGTGGYASLSPNVLGVGATSLTLNGANYGSETVWNNTYGKSGGGVSSIESRPTYQNGVASVVGGQRGAPDVAFIGDPTTGVDVYDTYNGTTAKPWTERGGTNIGAPAWAALIAIADQGRTEIGLGTLDGATQTLPFLYSLPASDFHDITTGGNGTNSAAAGYDLVTGLGTPIANLLVPDLAGFRIPPPTGAYEVADFAGHGIWRDSDAGWQQIDAVDATHVAVDAKGDVVAEIPGYGVWRFEDATGWVQLTGMDASQVGIAGNGDVVAEVPHGGIWRYENATGLVQLDPVNASQVGIDARGDVVAEISGYGVWRFEDSTGWLQLTGVDASSVAIAGNGYVVAELPKNGIWRFEDSTQWVQIDRVDASQVGIDAQGDVVAEISGYGVWRYENSVGWIQLTGMDAAQVEIAGNGFVVVDIAGMGISRYDNIYGWRQLIGATSTNIGLGA